MGVTTQDEAVCAGEFAQLFAGFEGGHDPGWPGVRVRGTPGPSEGDGDPDMTGVMPLERRLVAPVIRLVIVLSWPGNTFVFNLTAN
jgi:hypothetical protein